LVISIDPTGHSGILPMDLIINGANFVDTPQVFLDNYQALNVSLVNSTQLTALSPAGMVSGVYDVRVCNPDGQCGVQSGLFTVTDGADTMYRLFLPAIQR